MAAKFKTCFLVTLLFLLLIPTKNLFAQVDTFEFDNEVQQRRFRTPVSYTHLTLPTICSV